MKKNTLKSAVSALAVSAIALSASAMTAFAGAAGGQKYDIGNLDLSKATVKPTLTIKSEKLSLKEAQANPVRTITLTVAGANKKYAATGLHIDYDERLTIVPNEDDELATKGEAGSGLGAEIQPDGSHGLFMATDASGDKGKDGVLWSFDFKLPADLKGGEKFNVDIVYQSKASAEDLFTNVAKDEEGELMQAYVFTQGITQGVIEIDAPPTTTSTTSTTSTTTSKTTTSTTSKTTTSSTSTSSTSTSSTSSTSTSSTSTVSTSSTTKASGAKTTKAATTTKKAATTGKASDASKTGVAGAGVAVAGLAIAIGTAFAFRKKED